jgi:hypothetical protein
MELEDVSTVKRFGVEGSTDRYILVCVQIISSGRNTRKYLIRHGDGRTYSHAELFKMTRTELHPISDVTCLGGGFLKITPKIRFITINGESHDFGPAPRDLVAGTIAAHPAYRVFNINIEHAPEGKQP